MWGKGLLRESGGVPQQTIHGSSSHQSANNVLAEREFLQNSLYLGRANLRVLVSTSASVDRQLENQLCWEGYAAFVCSLTAFSIPGPAFTKSCAFMTGKNFTLAL